MSAVLKSEKHDGHPTVFLFFLLFLSFLSYKILCANFDFLINIPRKYVHMCFWKMDSKIQTQNQMSSKDYPCKSTFRSFCKYIQKRLINLFKDFLYLTKGIRNYELVLDFAVFIDVNGS